VKAQLIYNAHAGQLDERRDLEKAVHYLEKAVHYLEEQGWQVAWRETHGPGDAKTYAREAAAQGCQVAIAAGGDGTVGEVVNGLVGSDTVLGVLPVGTSNVWAKEVGIPSAPYLLHPQVRASLGVGGHWLLQAARVLVEGRRVRVDVGRVNDRHFLLWAGVGLDARVTEEMEQNPQVKRRLGRLAFYLAGIYTALGYRGVRAEVLVDDKLVTRRMILAVISNIQLYGGVVRISPLAQLDDGLLDVCILPLPIHADGDFLGYTPAIIEVVPQSLTVIVPTSAPSNLFQTREGEEAQGEPRGLLQRLADFVPYDPRRS